MQDLDCEVTYLSLVGNGSSSSSSSSSSYNCTPFLHSLLTKGKVKVRTGLWSFDGSAVMGGSGSKSKDVGRSLHSTVGLYLWRGHRVMAPLRVLIEDGIRLWV